MRDFSGINRDLPIGFDTHLTEEAHDILGYGGWVAGLVVAAPVVIRFVSPYADPVRTSAFALP